MDLGKRLLLACARTPNPARTGTWSLETERFGTTRAELRRLLAWLVERRVEVVVMEVTSDYWRGLYYLLQPHLNLMLVNPAHLKGIRRRKTDPSDAPFLAWAGASGMVTVPRISARRGGKRALVAVMHKIAIAIWHVLNDHTPVPRTRRRLPCPPQPRTCHAPHDQGSQPPRPHHPLRSHRNRPTCTGTSPFSCQSP
ncbi:transposase [Embleya sp. NPDC056575]|uniref:IS110 family transposase n=1 Tax=unclassified Embleya TaxID=2699296 RepID=UPI0036BA7C98